MEVKADVDCRGIEMEVRGKIMWLGPEEALKLAALLSTKALWLAEQIVKVEKADAEMIREEADEYAKQRGTTRAAIMQDLESC